jgi:hypothetical protein
MCFSEVAMTGSRSLIVRSKTVLELAHVHATGRLSVYVCRMQQQSKCIMHI